MKWLWFKSGRPDPVEKYGLTWAEVEELAAYNGRVSQGVVHTPEFVERMRVLQERFDAKRGRSDYVLLPTVTQHWPEKT